MNVNKVLCSIMKHWKLQAKSKKNLTILMGFKYFELRQTKSHFHMFNNKLEDIHLDHEMTN